MGADTAMDIRDLAYDLTHWKWDKGHIAQTVLDAVGLIPGIGVVKNLDEAGTVLKALFNGAETLTPALAVAAKISPEAAEWLMKGIAKYGDTVTDLLHGAAKNADDAAEWGLLVSAVRKAEESGDILKSADELIEGTGNKIKLNNLEDLFDNPKTFGDATPDEWHTYFQNNGFNPQPLGSKSSLKGIPFHQGGGFRINWGGDRYLQYHPSA